MELYTFRIDKPQVKIINIGDVHYGNPQCDREGLRNIVNQIETHDNYYWISTGDLLEVALEGTKGDIYRSQSLQTELEEITKVLAPISSKCLGIVGSNHHERLERKAGLNLDYLLSMWLKVPYLGYFGFLRVVLQDIGFYICLHHGYGFGRTYGAKANAMANIGTVAKGFDIYMTGHTHTYTMFVDKDYMLDRKHLRIMNMNVYYVSTGHFLNYKDSYAEKKAMKPKPKCCATVDLKTTGAGKSKKIRICKIDI